MNRLAIAVAELSGVWVAFFAVFLAIFAHRKPRQKPYLQRVAKKYSLPPLGLN